MRKNFFNFKPLVLIFLLLITTQLTSCTILASTPTEKEESVVEKTIPKTNYERMKSYRKSLNEYYVQYFKIPIEETYYWDMYLACSTDSLTYENIYDRKEGEMVFFYTTYDNVYETALYLDLAGFNLSTGKNLTLGDIEGFYSKEYEDDGTLRFYNNGNHPLIEQFVLWRLTPNNEISLEEGDYKFTISDYRRDITKIVGDYVAEHTEIAKFISTEDLETVSWEIVIDVFSLEDADEIMKKYQDPSYELHLSLEGETE